MSRSFKQTSARPFDYVEPTPPETSPLISSERDMWEELLSPRKPGVPLSGEAYAHMAELEAKLDMPAMLSEKQDNLCILPDDRRSKTDVIRPGQKSHYSGDPLVGVANVKRKLHVLSTRVDQRPRAHWVGVDPPWAPDALTSDSVREAHKQTAARWSRDGVHNNFSPPFRACQDASGDSHEEARPPRIAILDEDVKKPFPIGAAAGEEITILCAPPTERGMDYYPCMRPKRPCGAFDKAGTLYYWQEKRRQHVRYLIGQRGMSQAQATAVAERVADNGKTWAEMEDEAETAQRVLMVYGRLPLPEEKVQAKPKGKGNGKGKGSAAASGDAAPTTVDGWEAATQNPLALLADAAVAPGPSNSAPAQTVAGRRTARGSTTTAPASRSATMSPPTRLRGKRLRAPSAKAREAALNERASRTPSPALEESSAVADEEDEDVRPPGKRQRMSSPELMPSPPSPASALKK